MRFWVGRPASSRWRSTRTADNINIVDELVLCKKMAWWKIIFARYTQYYGLIVFKELSKLVDKCRRYSNLNQTQYTAWLKGPNFPGSCFPGSAETLVRRGEIANHHSIAYSLSNLCQKLRKSVDVRWSYSVQHQCRFSRHGVVGRQEGRLTCKDLCRATCRRRFRMSGDSWSNNTEQLAVNRGCCTNRPGVDCRARWSLYSTGAVSL